MPTDSRILRLRAYELQAGDEIVLHGKQTKIIGAEEVNRFVEVETSDGRLFYVPHLRIYTVVRPGA